MAAELSPTAREIVGYAQALLARGGYNGFSYADVAEAVQITKASIHHHFPSKAELVEVVVREYRERARLGFVSLEKQIADPLAQLHAYTGYWAACIRDGSAPLCVCAMLAAEAPAIPAEVLREVRGHFDDLAGWLARVLERGAAEGLFQLRSAPEAEAMAFMAAVHGAMLAARAHGDPEIFAATVKPVLHRLTHR